MLMNDFGESKITVKKDELLVKIRGNRDAHRGVFLEAQKGYREKVIDELDVMLKDAREGRGIRRTVELVEPQDHTRDYDRVIKMLEMMVGDEVVITDRQFAHFVLDEWEWQQAFEHSTRSYRGSR